MAIFLYDIVKHQILRDITTTFKFVMLVLKQFGPDVASGEPRGYFHVLAR